MWWKNKWALQLVSNEIKKLAKKLHIQLDTVLSPEVAKDQLKIAHANWKKAKESAPELYDEYSQLLVKAKAIGKGTSMKKMRKKYASH